MFSHIKSVLIKIYLFIGIFAGRLLHVLQMESLQNQTKIGAKAKRYWQKPKLYLILLNIVVMARNCIV